MDQFRRHETSARDYISGGGPAPGMMSDSQWLSAVAINLFSQRVLGRRSGTPSRFDASFYRTHDPMGYIPSDAQSLRSQATYASGMPVFTPGMGMGMGRGKSSYASSIISQDAGAGSSVMAGSVVGGPISTGSLAYSQSDRIRSRSPNGSEAGSLALSSQYGDYKSQGQDDASDLDDVKSQYTSGVTVF